MGIGRLLELVEGDNGKLSHVRVGNLFVQAILSYGFIIAIHKTVPSEGIVLGIAGIMAAAAGVTHGVSKIQESAVEQKRIEAMQPAAPNLTINQADKVNVAGNQ